MASSKMKQLRQGGSKETDELDNEDNEELFGDIGQSAAFSQTLLLYGVFPHIAEQYSLHLIDDSDNVCLCILVYSVLSI